jgi:NAD(P)-dependent dehydrogenase (short-subunit alcohol dehydrogenase family)
MKKNILLIGGSYGIGAAAAAMLVPDHQVWIASRTAENIPAGCTHLPFDAVADNASDLDLPEQLDGLVYCPGSINLKPFRALKPEAFHQDMEINFLSMVRCIQGLLPRLKRSQQASVVLFSTVAVQLGLPFHTSIAAAKGAVEGFARALAAEMAPTLRVNVIAPSLTDTPLASKLLGSEDKRDRMGERNPMKRVGTPEDIASMAAFLLSDPASWMTGQVLHVDGGMSSIQPA